MFSLSPGIIYRYTLFTVESRFHSASFESRELKIMLVRIVGITFLTSAL